MIRPLWATLLGGSFPPTNAFYDDWFQHGLYFSLFLLGYLVGTDEALWAELRRLRWRSLALALVSYFAFIAIDRLAGPEGFAGWELAGARVVSGFTMWLSIAAVLGWASAALSRPFRWLPYACEAVYPWYILHQSFIVLIAFWLVPMRLGPVLEPALVLTGTILACALTHEFIVRRSRWLRPLFGLKAAAPKAPAELAGAAAS